MGRLIYQLAVLIGMYCSSQLCGGSFGLVAIGNSDNTKDGNGFGAVPYDYQFGAYEVSNLEYVDFLNHVDRGGDNVRGLFTLNMTTHSLGGITINPSNEPGQKYGVKSGREDNPVLFVSWFDAARFCNWQHNGRGHGDTETGAYELSNFSLDSMAGQSIMRSSAATWFIPSADEWYKAAFHKNDGATGNYWDYPFSTDQIPFSSPPPGSAAPSRNNTANFFKNQGPINGYDDGLAVTGALGFNGSNYLSDVGAYSGSVSPYGTFDQAGNVAEWTEQLITSPQRPSAIERGVWGGAWSSTFEFLSANAPSVSLPPSSEFPWLGFRVATVIPEPKTATLLFGAACGVLTWLTIARFADR